MAMIDCPECDREISDRAAACPNCGTPIADAADTAATGATLTTTQETSKRFKMQILCAWLMIIAGGIGLYKGGERMTDGAEPSLMTSAVPVALLAIGGIWYIATKVRIWWHHK